MKGFLLNDARIFSQKGLFLNHHFNNYMVREDKQYVKAYEVGFNARASNLKKVFGEFFEREVLINSNDSQNSETVVNYLSENNSKYLAKGIFISKDRFVDSNGMASHTNSKEVIKTAFFEFFERQSFLTNFLSQTAVPRLLFDNEESLIIADNYLKNYVDKINYYDVSLDRSLHVVLCIGYGSKKCIGLGTSTQIKEAIKKSQIEALQYFAQDISKFNSKDMLDSLSQDENDFYHKKFDQLSVEDFIKNYSYLLHNNLISKQVMDQENSFVLPDFLEKIKKEFNINPVIAMFESDQTIPHLKIVKIYDENWFPHMNPNFYNKEVYKFISKSINKDLLTSIKYIPFP
ncbi:YcaO-like family protein [Lactococcus lactis]|uniref:YcaO-like family protein n=1 Tax=Lactococcus lactis TaxID=1358 RepID=UPI0010120FB1|nr:YcaO-like family protein [Lactococcus lactis]MCT3116692.1 hypothetical protein [Lactococcus lactis]MDM7474356.1 YcaO-like family protein [Lactococcus lactis]MDM7522465.1 YcaO-like family protein [Lactococcus lactis]RXS50273.1 hypothetical protein ES032_12740 [Lactococcus lactis]